jgi:hypothetical protein
MILQKKKKEASAMHDLPAAYIDESLSKETGGHGHFWF